MLHVTEHSPEVSTRSVNPYAHESSRKKLQQDTQDRHTDGSSKTIFLDVLRFAHSKAGLISKSIVLLDANTSIGHGSTKFIHGELLHGHF